jgi:hypothetical protein
VVGAIRTLRYISPDESGVDLAQYEISPGIFVPLSISLDANGNPLLTATNPGRVIDATDYTQQFEYDGSGNLLYHGRATPGTPTSEPFWQIRQYTYVGTNLTAIQYAGGTADFISAWDARASLSYS